MNFSEAFKFKKSHLVITLAQLHAKRKEMEKSYKALIDFMIKQRHKSDDINSEVILCLIKIILPIDDETEEMRRNNIRTFMMVLLDLHEQESSLDNIRMTKEMHNNFESVVVYILNCIKRIMSEDKQLILYQDVHWYTRLNRPRKIEFAYIGTESWQMLIGLLSKPQSEDFYAGGVVVLFRMIKIMFELNNYWGVEFKNLIFQPIIQNSVFEIFDSKFRETQSKEQLKYYTYNCGFLFTSEYRPSMYVELFRKIGWDQKFDSKHKIYRNDYINYLIDEIPKANAKGYWYFTFDGELGNGRGPTQELYIKFSQYIQRYDLNLWIGDPQMSSDGIEYVHNPCGLFPSPSFTPLDEYSKNLLKLIGIMMAKSKLDNLMMDLRFSKSFCKYMILGHDKSQCLNLNDITDVYPGLDNFLKDLVIIMKQATRIKNDSVLTHEQKLEALSEIKYNGRPFEDLHINFTVPGYSNIEMVEGGADIFLTVDNLEKYLKLVVGWLLYKGPQEKLDSIREGYESIMLDTYLPLQVDDMLSLFCGMDAKPWSIIELEQNCNLEGDLAINTPVIRHLFKILSSYSMEEQKQFLQFVISSTNLPIGGLSSLNPRLTIQLQITNGNPDLYLPQSATCFHKLIIPIYSDSSVLRKQFSVAYQEGGDSFYIV